MSFIRFVAPFSVTMPKFLGGLTVQLLLSVAIFALVMRQGAVYGYDSASYIAPAIIRTPLTPWIIVAFRFVFGESYRVCCWSAGTTAATSSLRAASRRSTSLVML